MQETTMTAILSAQADAFNDTDSQLTKIEGFQMALDDLAASHDALNTPDPRANAGLHTGGGGKIRAG
jgi:hypothetical protein